MRKVFYLIGLMAVTGQFVFSCQYSSNPFKVMHQDMDQVGVKAMGEACDSTVVTLYAGQHIDVGTVSVWNDDENLYVQYTTTGGWVMTKTHLAVAESLEGIPQTKKGNPIPGKFPYKAEHDLAITEYSYVIVKEESGYEVEDEVYIAAHADVELLDENGGVIQEEGAWADGEDFPGKNWAMYFTCTVKAVEYDFVWTYKNPMITPRHGAASTVWDDKLYVFGGHQTSWIYPYYGQQNESYDSVTDQWSSHAVKPRGSYDSTAVALGDYIYVIGGCNMGGNYDYASIDRYDAVNDSWIADYDSFPVIIQDAGAVAYEGLIYIIGGFSYRAGQPYEFHNEVYAFNPSAPPGSRFTALANMPTSRACFATILLEGKIYCIGGGGSSGTLTVNEVYDISSNTWDIFAPLSLSPPEPISGREILGGAINGKIYVLTGEWASGGPGRIAKSYAYEYDPQHDSWLQKIAPQTKRLGFVGEVINDKLYIAGGADWSNCPSPCTTTHVTETVEVGCLKPICSIGMEKIAFSSNLDGNEELYVMDADGSNQTRLTNNPADDRYPGWSPDRTKIAFASDRDGDWDIWVLEVDDPYNTLENLTNNTRQDSGYPRWSPDGTKIVYMSFYP